MNLQDVPVQTQVAHRALTEFCSDRKVVRIWQSQWIFSFATQSAQFFFATGLIFGFNTTAPTQELKLIYFGTPTRSGQAYNAIGDMWPSDGTASEQGLRNAIAVAEIAPSMSHEQLLSWTLLKETLAAFKNEFQPR